MNQLYQKVGPIISRRVHFTRPEGDERGGLKRVVAAVNREKKRQIGLALSKEIRLCFCRLLL
jgi:hypothetical protein